MGAYMHLMYVFVWRGGGGGSTQTNIVRLKQNVDNWRRPLTEITENFVRVKTSYSSLRELSHESNYHTARAVLHTLTYVHGFKARGWCQPP